MSNPFEDYPANNALKRMLEIQAVQRCSMLIFSAPSMLVQTVELAKFWVETFGPSKIDVVLPCGCGWFGDYKQPCACDVEDILAVNSHMKKVIHGNAYDIYCYKVELPTEPNYIVNPNRYSEKLSDVMVRITEARIVRHHDPYLTLDHEAENMLHHIVKIFSLNIPMKNSICHVAKSISCLHGRKEITLVDLAEAAQYLQNMIRIFR